MGTRRTLALLTTAIALGAGSARADEPAEPSGPPVHSPERTRLVLGLAIGGGELHVFSDTPSFTDTKLTDDYAHVSLRVGTAFSQRFLGMFFLDFGTGDTQSHTMVGVALQPYLTERVFLRFGAGADRLKIGKGEGSTCDLSNCADWGIGVLGGLGVEFLQFRTMALDVELMFRSGFHSGINVPSDNLIAVFDGTLGIGVTWF